MYFTIHQTANKDASLLAIYEHGGDTVLRLASSKELQIYRPVLQWTTIDMM